MVGILQSDPGLQGKILTRWFNPWQNRFTATVSEETFSHNKQSVIPLISISVTQGH
ncbi:MAG: hypothetical protein JWP80_2222 [Pseudomonas sp.]|nr:hypothetical protein [Pseudomonas sp.]